MINRQSMEPEQKSKKRAAEDAVHITFMVPAVYFEERPNPEYEYDRYDKEVRYKHYADQGWKDQKLEDLLTAERLKEMGIEGRYDTIYKPDPWSQKQTFLGAGFTLGMLKRHYSDKSGECTLILQPDPLPYYECVALTAEEIVAFNKLIDGVAERRVTKKQKTQ